MDMIEAKNITKHFKIREMKHGIFGAIKGLFNNKKKLVKAVENFSFAVKAGEIVGLIGPNGAGKSTIVKMATGLILPTSGEIKVMGLEPFKYRIKIAYRYGVVFGQRSNLWWNLSPMESFYAIINIYGLNSTTGKRQIDYLVNVLDLKEFFTTPLRQLSLGQRMRCELASALIHEPELIFLDEPTIGLDVVSKSQVRNYIKRINKEKGVSILLTSHDMVDVERLCDRVIIIDKGRHVYNGQLEPLRQRFAPEKDILLELSKDPANLKISKGSIIYQEGARIKIRFDSKESTAMDILEEVSHSSEVLDFVVHELPIDEVIARIYQEGF
ncbi:MAG: ATP-binding cassette domain-containing protein [Candidatus Firestonebacteria bacterium]